MESISASSLSFLRRQDTYSHVWHLARGARCETHRRKESICGAVVVLMIRWSGATNEHSLCRRNLGWGAEGSCVSIRLTDKEVWFIVAFSPLFNGLGGFSSNRVSCIRLDHVRDAA